MSYPRRSLNRRECLHTLGASFCALLLSKPAHSAAAGPDARAWLRHFARTQDFPTLRRLGAAYLRAHPGEGSVAQLLQLMLPGDDGSYGVRLHRSIAEDWRHQDVVTLDGWLSSRTEARLCAFCHLDGSAS